MGIMKEKFQMEREAYQDFEQGSYQESKKSKITRVNRIYNLFNELSIIEQDKFINLIKHKMIE